MKFMTFSKAIFEISFQTQYPPGLVSLVSQLYQKYQTITYSEVPNNNVLKVSDFS